MSGDSPRVQAIFLDALQQTPAERSEFLDQQCAGDAELRSRVEALLDAHDRTSSFLDSPFSEREDSAETIVTRPLEQRGSLIGPYKLLQQVGEGGMGVVYMAEQLEPVHRRVALKIIKPGMDTRMVIARFEAERQALAMMDHPNIAKVLDVGTTHSGRPFFVMELVRGVPITEYCDNHRLSPRQRLELFVPVCQAVQHAHQKGIIHRDIKPSNVLVAEYDDQPVPKIIDFGVAKAIEQRLTAKTMFTELGQVIGTPDYMSPEQAKLNQRDIDTRSDIYSLGVLLYELLSGTTPFDRERLRSAAFDELLRIIREEEPPKLSVRLSTAETLPSIAANRDIEPAELSRQLSGELDWIVLKAMEKDRSRRYETANGLASDVRRYLEDEPVQACPPSRSYRFQKFARRNKRPVVFAATAAALLLVLSAASFIAASRFRSLANKNAALVVEKETALAAEVEAKQAAKREEARANQEAAWAKTAEEKAVAAALRAQQEAETAQAITNFLSNDLIGMARPSAQVEKQLQPSRNITVGTLLDLAAQNLPEKFTDRPEVEIQLQKIIGDTYASLGQFRKAEEHQRRAAELVEQIGDQEATLSQLSSLAHTLGRTGKPKEAERMARRMYETYKSVYPPEHPKLASARNSLANALIGLESYAEAEELHREALELNRKLHGHDSSQEAMSLNNLAISVDNQNRKREAEQLYRQAWNVSKQAIGPDDSSTLLYQRNLAYTLKDLGRYADAEQLFQDNLDRCRRTRGAEHPDTASAQNGLLATLCSRGEFLLRNQQADEAVAAFERALNIDPGSARPFGHWRGGFLTALSQTGNHERLLEAVDLLVAHSERNQHANLSSKVVVLKGLGFHEAAEQVCRNCIRNIELRRKEEPSNIGLASDHAELLVRLRPYYDATERRDLPNQAAEICRSVIGSVTIDEGKNTQLGELFGNLALAEQTAGHPDDALQAALQSLQFFPRNHSGWKVNNRLAANLYCSKNLNSGADPLRAIQHAVEVKKHVGEWDPLREYDANMYEKCLGSLATSLRAMTDADLEGGYWLTIGYATDDRFGEALGSWSLAEFHRVRRQQPLGEPIRTAREDAQQLLRYYLDSDDRVVLADIDLDDEYAVEQRKQLLIGWASTWASLGGNMIETKRIFAPYRGLDDDPASFWQTLGDASFESQRYQTAFDYYAQALEQDPDVQDRAWILFKMGKARLQLDEYEVAADWMLKADRLMQEAPLEGTPYPPHFYIEPMGRALTMAERWEDLEAIRDRFRESMAGNHGEGDNPWTPQVRFVRFCTLFPDGVEDWESLVAMAHESFERDPNFNVAEALTGKTLLRAGRYPAAAKVLLQGSNGRLYDRICGPERVELMVHLGDHVQAAETLRLLEEDENWFEPDLEAYRLQRARKVLEAARESEPEPAAQ